MVTSTRQTSGALSQIVVRPNQSLSWAHTKLVFLGIAGISLTVAVAFALIGFWPVLPFAGLELAALGYCFYRCARHGQLREVITVGDGEVRVERGIHGPEQSWSFQRSWLSVLLIPARPVWHPSRLVLRERGRSLEIGRFLNEGERRTLADELSNAVAGGHRLAGGLA